MGRREEAVEKLQEGLSPNEIAREMGVSLETVAGYLFEKVGDGAIRRSDMLFAFPRATRTAIEDLIQKVGTTGWRLYEAIQKSSSKINKDQLDLYLQLRDARVVLGDMYEFIRCIEVTLHSVIRDTFLKEYGEENWWRKGIPENIRVECCASRERDPEPANDPYCYTNFMHLKEILDKRWAILSRELSAKLVSDKRELLSRLAKLNRIRNVVMHPVRVSPPTEEDFEFVREFHRDLTTNTPPA